MVDWVIESRCISLKGDLVVSEISSLFEAFPDFSEPEYCVDLSKIDRSDSAGLALLVYWSNQAEKKSSRISYKNCPQSLLEIARISGLETLFEEK